VLEPVVALHALGSASYRVEDAMDAVCRRFGLRGVSSPADAISASTRTNAEPHVVLCASARATTTSASSPRCYDARTASCAADRRRCGLRAIGRRARGAADRGRG